LGSGAGGKTNHRTVEAAPRARSAPRNGESVQEYEQSQKIEAPAGEVFAWLSDVGNLPGYLPPVTDASIEGPSAGGVPGRPYSGNAARTPARR
jgi:hypothetical protein